MMMVLIILIKIDPERAVSLSVRQADWCTEISQLFILTALGFTGLIAFVQDMPRHSAKYLATIFMSIFLILGDAYLFIEPLAAGMEMMRLGGGFAGVVL